MRSRQPRDSVIFGFSHKTDVDGFREIFGISRTLFESDLDPVYLLIRLACRTMAANTDLDAAQFFADGVGWNISNICPSDHRDCF